MKCQCGNEIIVGVAASVRSKGAKMLGDVTSVVTVRCDKCGKVMQVPVSSKNFLSVSKDK